MDACGKKSKPVCLYAEIVKEHQEHLNGLMGRKFLSSNSGMLFDFGKEKELSFWMSNTYIPLQIAFITKNGKIGQIEKMVPLSTRQVKSNGKYKYALEVNDGWFDKNNIFIGAQVALPTELIEQTEELTQPQQTIDPSITILQSNKDILKSVDDYEIKIIIEYIAKSNVSLPPKAIEPPFEFKDTAEGDVDGLLTAWDSQKGRFGSFIIDNIVSIKDLEGNSIQNVQQVENIFNKVPLTPREEQSIEGKLLG